MNVQLYLKVENEIKVFIDWFGCRVLITAQVD